MADGALRGTRLGSASYESEDNVVLAPRQNVIYDCPNGRVISVPMAEEAEVPALWECHCGADALQRDGVRPEVKPTKAPRTHWDMLLERRSIAELEVLLEERLAFVRHRPAAGFEEQRRSA